VIFSGPVYDPRVRRVAGAVLPLLYAGDNVTCPCCDGRFRRFVRRYGADALCPRCLSLGRHRLLWLFLRDRVGVATREASVLHFAPEEALTRRLRTLPNLRYLTADLDPSIGMVTADITDIPFDAGAFDIVICSHVLEHVPDDRKAMREIFRVLRPGGAAYLMQPVSSAERTDEDLHLTDEAERRRRFGQRDHVRIYGQDFVERAGEAGFDVAVDDYSRSLDPQTVAAHGLSGDPIYVCRKPQIEPSGRDSGPT
jgi:SAM-dependent methyltransferase